MSVIDDYLAPFDPQDQKAINHIRTMALQIIPGLQDDIRYGIPALTLNNRYIIGFAVFKDHLSIFPGSAPIVEHAEALQKFKTSKGTVQFTANNPISDDTLAAIIASCRNN